MKLYPFYTGDAGPLNWHSPPMISGFDFYQCPGLQCTSISPVQCNHRITPELHCTINKAKFQFYFSFYLTLFTLLVRTLERLWVCPVHLWFVDWMILGGEHVVSCLNEGFHSPNYWQIVKAVLVFMQEAYCYVITLLPLS